jgi:hypothetical protein
VIFLLGRIKYEIKLIGENIPLIGLSAFLCVIGGILLWVSGGSSWFALRIGISHGFTLSLAGAFVLWTITYGLVGAVLSLITIICRAGILCDKRCIIVFGVVMISYLLMLSWYAIFFCTRLTVFPLILLLCSVLLICVELIIMWRTLRILLVINLIIEAIQVYFIIFSFSIMS